MELTAGEQTDHVDRDPLLVARDRLDRQTRGEGGTANYSLSRLRNVLLSFTVGFFVLRKCSRCSRFELYLKVLGELITINGVYINYHTMRPESRGPNSNEVEPRAVLINTPFD